MANIPPIRRSLAPLSSPNKRGQMRFSQAESIEDDKKIRFTDRRFSKDRRIKHIKMMFDRRKMYDRRNKSQSNEVDIGKLDRYITTGRTIDTTA
ncbi:MAG: hypothetical protein OEY61_14045 [Gammaproteobacteria bacterium]|nr:hypothetical protein [Gammaproteobacteria bacterium]